MPDFSLKNLKEIDDAAAERGPDIEARFARKHLDSEHLGVSYFRYGPGYRSAIPTGTASRRRRTSSSRAPVA